jgi:DNA-binding transcriptional MerR regulator
MKAPDAFRTISEVAADLELPQHVLRFWETRFSQIKPMKRGGGRRYYRPEDVDLLRGIRLLLYSEGFTIRGVQRLLKEKGVAFVVEVGQKGTVETVTTSEPEPEDDDVTVAAEPRREEPVFAAAPPPSRADTPPPDEQAEDDPPARHDPPPPPVFRLAPEKRRRMQAALEDLLEAKRLLEQARQGSGLSGASARDI